eukprot:TRINITY_DN10148_c0_g2_i1.p1 TRINITY_DN10148_c0_g2~~TRINITY_DN10148_c0_g2_i1.p1  ORF type:complete len:242 (+),score=26.86 TRINITY_DN10148_c0_g2_i1:67-726(+)
MRNSLTNKVKTDCVPPLEGILMKKMRHDIENPIKYEEVRKKKVSYSMMILEHIEDYLTEEAGKLLRMKKQLLIKQRELARKMFRERKERPMPLENSLASWANKYKAKMDSSAKDHPRLAKRRAARPKLKGSKFELSPNASEVKFNAKEFKTFLSWRNEARDIEDNDVSSVLKQSGEIKVDFAPPKSPPIRTSLDSPAKKRKFPDSTGSDRSSIDKRYKL